MKISEKRILRVSEMIADNLLEAMLDFRHCTQQTNGLWDAMEVLDPDIKRLDDLQREILRNRSIARWRGRAHHARIRRLRDRREERTSEEKIIRN